MTSYTYSSPKLEKLKPFCKNINTICKSKDLGCNLELGGGGFCPIQHNYYPTYLAKNVGDNTNIITFSQPDHFHRLFYHTNVEKQMIPNGNGGVYNYKLDSQPCMYTAWQNESCENEIIEPFDTALEKDTSFPDFELSGGPCSEYSYNTAEYEKCKADNKHKGRYVIQDGSNKMTWIQASTTAGDSLPKLAKDTSERCKKRQLQLEKNYTNPDKVREILEYENCGHAAWWRDWLDEPPKNMGPLRLNSTLKSEFNTQCILNRSAQRYGGIDGNDVPSDDFETTTSQIINDCDTSIQDDMELHHRNLNYKYLLEQLPQYENGPERTYCN